MISDCSRRTPVQHIIDTVIAASLHIVPTIDNEGEEHEAYLVFGVRIFGDQQLGSRITLRQAHIDSESLLFAILSADPGPPPLVDTSD